MEVTISSRREIWLASTDPPEASPARRDDADVLIKHLGQTDQNLFAFV
jgi:hypothetical protein